MSSIWPYHNSVFLVNHSVLQSHGIIYWIVLKHIFLKIFLHNKKFVLRKNWINKSLWFNKHKSVLAKTCLICIITELENRCFIHVFHISAVHRGQSENLTTLALSVTKNFLQFSFQSDLSYTVATFRCTMKHTLSTPSTTFPKRVGAPEQF